MKRICKRWSEQDLAILRAEYPNGSTDELAAKLGRTADAVTIRANTFGIHKTASFICQGIRRHKKPHLPIGTFRVQSEGDGLKYLWQKVAADGNYKKDWQRFHKLVWIRAHGPLPPGKLVVFKPGRRSLDPERVTIDALELMTRREMISRNRYRNEIPPALAEVAHLRRLLMQSIYKRERHEEQNRRSA